MTHMKRVTRSSSPLIQLSQTRVHIYQCAQNFTHIYIIRTRRVNHTHTHTHTYISKQPSALYTVRDTRAASIFGGASFRRRGSLMTRASCARASILRRRCYSTIASLFTWSILGTSVINQRKVFSL